MNRALHVDYPAVADYAEALQHPQKCFANTELKSCRPEPDARGDPRPRTGGQAAVFKLERSGVTFAVKVFKSYNGEREQRYRLISEYLDQVKGRHLIGFQYMARGIRVRGEWYPILRMDWVAGLTLTAWVQEKVKRKDKAAIRQLADRWVELIAALKASRIAHGDLQHGNVMVVGSDLVLVDYDGMFVPTLENQPTDEVGLPAYQHPGRASAPSWGPDLDDFSAWIIWIALRAIAVDLSLWDRHVVKTKNENLLFSLSDILDPGKSILWRDLQSLRDPDVVDRAKELRDSISKPFEHLPAFRFDRTGELRALCNKSPRPWDEIATLAATLFAGGTALPADLGGLADEAQARLATRQKLEQALQGGDPRQIATAYHAPHLDDWAACQKLVTQARRVAPVGRALLDVEEALKRSADGREAIAVWRKHAAALAREALAAPLRQQVEGWERRLAARDALVALLTRGGAEQAIVDAWNKLQHAGGHPDIDPADPRLGLAVRRQTLLARLRALPTMDSEATDRLLVQLWDDDLLRGCAEAGSLRSRWEGAVWRVQMLATPTHVAIPQQPVAPPTPPSTVPPPVPLPAPPTISTAAPTEVKPDPQEGQRQDLVDRIAALVKRGAGSDPDGYFEALAGLGVGLPSGYAPTHEATVAHARAWLAGREKLKEHHQAGRWTDFAALSSGDVFAKHPCPRGLEDPIRQVGLRVQARRNLEEALATGEIKKVAPAYRPDLLDDWVECAGLVKRAKEARALLVHLPGLEAAVAAPGDGRELLRLWAPHAGVPAGWRELDAVRPVADAWRPRLEAYDAFVALKKANRSPAQALVAAWERLQKVGGHPDAVSLNGEADQAVRRARSLVVLSGLTDEGSEVGDRTFLAAWDEETLKGWWEGEALRPRRDRADLRIRAVEELRARVGRPAPDHEIAAAADQLPAGYRYDPALQRAGEAARLRSRLRQAMAAGSDLEIATAWDACRQASAEPVGAERERCLLALRRRQALKTIRGLAPTLPADRQDREWVQCWQDGDLDHCKDVSPPERQRLDLARRRVAGWADLERALTVRDIPALRRLASSPDLATYPPHLQRKKEIDAVLAEASRLDAARQRLRDQVLGMLAGGGSDQAVGEAWKKLQSLGGHPDISPTEPRLERCLRRLAALEGLRGLPTEESESADRQWVERWDEDLLRGCPEASPQRPRWDKATQRVRLVDRIAALVKRGAGSDPDGYFEALAGLGVGLPSGYAPTHEATVAHARAWLAGREKLKEHHQAGRWTDFAALSSGDVFAKHPCPRGLEDPIRQVGLRIQARRRVEGALATGMLRKVAEAYQPDLLDDWGECAGLVKRAKEARALLVHLPGLEAAVAAPGDGRELLRLWAPLVETPAGWRELDAIRRIADVWRPRIEACDAFLALARANRSPAQGLIDAWKRLEAAGGHPDAQMLGRLAELSARRARCLAVLSGLTDEGSEVGDRTFLAAWDEETLKGWWEGEALRPRRDRADLRIRAVEELRTRVGRRAPDHEIAAAADQLPAGYRYDPALQRAVDATRLRVGLLVRLGQELDAQAPSDLKIASAWDACRQAGAEPVGAERERCLLALRRRQALLALRNLAPTLPADRQDREWLQRWQDGDLDHCADVSPPERQRLDLARQRTDDWAEAERALIARDLAALRRVARGPRLIDYPPYLQRQKEISDLLWDDDLVNTLLEALEKLPETLVENLDLSVVDKWPERFRPHRERLRELLERELSGATMRLPRPPEWEDRGGGAWVLKLHPTEWSWHLLGLGTHLCLACVDSQQQPPGRPEGRPYSVFEPGVLRVPVLAATGPVYVTLWPAVVIPALDLTVAGLPLQVGPVARPAEKRRGWGLW